MIECSGLVKSYRKRIVVNNVNINANEGEIVGLLGPNGAGKTTTFYMIAGLIKPDKGSVVINDEDITHLPMYKRAQKGLSYLPQEPSVFRGMTVEENIDAILEFLYPDIKTRKLVLEKLLNDLNIAHIRNTKAYAVSGGERRRVEVARALATKPKFILLDEPFAGIDPIIVDELKMIIKDLKNRGIGIIITDHNVREILDIVDRAYLLFDGKIVREGKPDELVRDEEVIDMYLGKRFCL
ncbi:LPS export ABC transporter ATP-binding protein [Hippea maritima]|uniref:Sulfate-transporting ATPase n=1 Tax=Hippea maritima (strain ATCC 700847 / DSM 10411 / MH2) TaxID=760142 RepID=F2LUA9_HIPMA|nr:LPS export ABC transporter ATP-binding protein [Hippea maritima]AEA33435.1 Sulfate-transporting ATPase [Hippea maritima DSM 10411]